MTELLRQPAGNSGKLYDITPDSARGPQSPDWAYVGFGLYRLAPGETVTDATEDREVILVLVEGKAKLACSTVDFGEMGDRMDVFEKSPPHCAYVPNGETWSAIRAKGMATDVSWGAPARDYIDLYRRL